MQQFQPKFHALFDEIFVRKLSCKKAKYSATLKIEKYITNYFDEKNYLTTFMSVLFALSQKLKNSYNKGPYIFYEDGKVGEEEGD